MTDIVEAAARAREEDPRLRWGNDMFVEAEPVQVYVSEREMVSNLRLLGLPAVTAEGLSLIHRQISREKNPLEALKTLAQKLRAHAAAHGGASSSAVDKDAVMEVIAAETRNEEDTRQDAYSVVSSFDFPRWGYDAARKSYFCIGKKFPLHSSASAKLSIFSERLSLVEARIKRHPTFAPPIAGSLKKSYVQLTAIDALPTLAAAAMAGASSSGGGGVGGGMGGGMSGGAAAGVQNEVYLVGMLTLPSDASSATGSGSDMQGQQWCLEDGHGKSVLLDFAPHLQRKEGFYGEMTVAMVSGHYDPDSTTAAGGSGSSSSDAVDAFGFSTGGNGASSSAAASSKFVPLVEGRVPGVFRVQFICHPPFEDRFRTLQAMGNISDSFGVITTPAEYQRALKLESGGRRGVLQAAGSSSSSSSSSLSSSSSTGLMRLGTGGRSDGADGSSEEQAIVPGAPIVYTEDEKTLFDHDRAKLKLAPLSDQAFADRQTADATSFIVVSDLHLDSPAVLSHFAELLQQFADNDAMPGLLVLMGNFSSKPFGQSEGGADRDRYKSQMASLAVLLHKHKEAMDAKGTCVVVVPGPNDPGTNGCLPRPPLPAYFCHGLLALNNQEFGGAAAASGASAIAGPGMRVVLMSNPCRVRYHTQELLFFRCDLTTKLKRRTIIPPLPGSPPEVHMLRTILGQGHLTPLPLQGQPVYWEHDHSLRLGPYPDVMVIAEGSDKAWSYCGTGKGELQQQQAKGEGGGGDQAAVPAAPQHRKKLKKEDHEAGLPAGLLAFNPASFAKTTSFLEYKPSLRDGETFTVVPKEDAGGDEDRDE